jgi:DNA/RNA-binding domain of Phe-tRNA-synthetase-like protein
MIPKLTVPTRREAPAMYFQHAPDIWRDFPELAAGVVVADGIHPDVNVEDRIATYTGIAAERLGGGPESELPEIQAWRRTFSKMGLKPTQYRCASEALLRRFRKEGVLPRLHPLIDLCNSISLAFAIPVAVIDVANVVEGIEVRRADGTERYETFGGETEHPEAGEVIFADAAGQAHARRWTNRQSGRSAVRDTTTSVIIVAEAMHDTASDDIERLIGTVANEVGEFWSVAPRTAVLTAVAPRFEL